jgi:ribose transport system permease protein
LLIALVIGGMPLTGGAGAKIQSAIIGGLILAILSNGMVLLGVKIEIQQAIKGIIFLIAVYLSFERESVVMIK